MSVYCIEFGANIGMNLKALKSLYPNLEMHAIEINPNAVSELSKTISSKRIFNGSILDYTVNQKFDLTLIKGVLIHINEDFTYVGNDNYKDLINFDLYFQSPGQ